MGKAFLKTVSFIFASAYLALILATAVIAFMPASDNLIRLYSAVNYIYAVVSE